MTFVWSVDSEGLNKIQVACERDKVLTVRRKSIRKKIQRQDIEACVEGWEHFSMIGVQKAREMEQGKTGKDGSGSDHGRP